MSVFLLTCATMIAFAFNSILTRLAVDGGYMDPLAFAILRVLAGAAVLSALVWAKGGRLPLRRSKTALGAASLAVYMIGFSLAYMTLDAGLGALILFGVVQIGMFVYEAATGRRPELRQIAGACIAFAGLLLALWPREGADSDPAGAAWMALAGLGWAAYTLNGRTAGAPLAATAANFVLCLPLLVFCLLPFVAHASLAGVGLAIVCGGLTSGLGYALWYRVLPRLGSGVPAVVQLSVPILAIALGALLLGETLSLMVSAAAALVVIGIGLAVTSRSSPAGRS